MTRGVLFMVWKGDRDDTPGCLQRALDSVKRWHPDLPIHVETMPDKSTLLCKSAMLDISPFDETLYLDADCVVMGDLSFGFEKATKHQIAICICECPWARRFLGLQHRGDIVEYNTGMLFFTKQSKPVFDLWKQHNLQLNSAHRFRSVSGVQCMANNDQAGFSAAVDDLGFNPFVLPLNWNFRKAWHRHIFGPVKIWHCVEPVTDELLAWNERHGDVNETIDFGVIAA